MFKNLDEGVRADFHGYKNTSRDFEGISIEITNRIHRKIRGIAAGSATPVAARGFRLDATGGPA